MKRNHEILIIGGGVIGLTSAFKLALFGHRVTVIDQREMGREASWAAAGIIPPGCLQHARLGVDQLRAYGSQHFDNFSALLKEASGIDNGYHRCGAVERFPIVRNDLITLWQSERIRFSFKQASTVEFPDFAQVRTPRHVRALTVACQKLGVEFRPNVRLQSWIIERDVVTGIETHSGSIHADRYVVAAGAWTERLLQPLSVELGIHPVKGEILLYKPKRPLLSTIMLECKCYLVPCMDGRILVGSTESVTDGFDNQVTPEARLSLSQFAEELLPALAKSPIEQHWCGLRPGSKDGVPTIDFVPGYPNVVVTSGHFRAGIQQSIGTAEIVTAMLNDVPSSIAREPFAFDRAAPTYEPLFQS